MALALGAGESLTLDDPYRESESGRFRMVLEADMNLAVYAYTMSRSDPPAMRKVYLGSTDVHDPNAINAVLTMNSGGWLELIYRNTVLNSRVWRYWPHILNGQAVGTPGSTLQMQDDGRLVIYKPGNVEAVWAIGDISPGVMQDAVMPGVVTISIDGGKISDSGERTLVNDTGFPVGVRDNNQFRRVVPSGEVPIETVPAQLTNLTLDSTLFLMATHPGTTQNSADCLTKTLGANETGEIRLSQLLSR